MPYAKLSDQTQKLANPQRSDAFVKQFRNAVREGEIEAADLPSRFTLPKQFSRRGQNETYQRDARDMVFDVTPAFEKWFEATNAELATHRRGAKVKPTLENIEAGLLDFKELAAATRQKLEASYAKGQTLGRSRKGAGKKTTGSRSRKK